LYWQEYIFTISTVNSAPFSHFVTCKQHIKKIAMTDKRTENEVLKSKPTGVEQKKEKF